MHLNKRGVALLQVLIIAAVLAGIATMILRAVVSRTSVVHQNQKIVTARMLIEGCMKDVAELWVAKTPQEYADDLDACRFGVDEDGNDVTQRSCFVPFPGRGVPHDTIEVVASFVDGPDSDGRCQLRYSIVDGRDWL